MATLDESPGRGPVGSGIGRTEAKASTVGSAGRQNCSDLRAPIKRIFMKFAVEFVKTRRNFIKGGIRFLRGFPRDCLFYIEFCMGLGQKKLF